MATFTLANDSRFKVGNTIYCYRGVGNIPANVTPVTSATVASDSTTTFSGLTIGERYLAGKTVTGPFVAFRVPAPPEEEGNVSVSTLSTALDDILETESGWPDRPTLDGEEIPWPMRWRSLPGSVVSPAGKMAEFDTFLPVPEAE